LRQLDEVYLAEGVIDCLSLLDQGLPAIGIPGAHGFKQGWVPLFDQVSDVIVAFDRDDAGRKGRDRIVAAFAAAGRLGIKTVEWPSEVNDANEFMKLYE
jgi:DNA primase